MKTIWKTSVTPDSVRDEPFPMTFKAPQGAKVVSVAKYRGAVCVWFEVDPELPDAVHTVWCVGTGFGGVPAGKRFIGTVVDGVFVWHFYAN